MKTCVCSLCAQHRQLQNSHIRPKFFGRILRQSSTDGVLKHPDNDSQQDYFHTPLLCSTCEQLFSKIKSPAAQIIRWALAQTGGSDSLVDLENFARRLNWAVAVIECGDRNDLAEEATRDAVRSTIFDFLHSDQTGRPDTYTEAEIQDKVEAVFRHVYYAYPTAPSPVFASA